MLKETDEINYSNRNNINIYPKCAIDFCSTNRMKHTAEIIFVLSTIDE